MALETPTNLWKHMAICQHLNHDQESSKFEPFKGFLGLGLTLTKARNGVKNRIFAFFHFPPIIWLQNRIQNHELLNESSVSQLSGGTFGFHWRALVRERRSTKDKWLKLTTLLESSAIFAVFSNYYLKLFLSRRHSAVFSHIVDY